MPNNMRMGDKISIVIPAYNCAQWLGAAVRSCLEQTLQPLEVIVVDDGSTDATPDFFKGFGGGGRFHRVDNGGVSRARNIGARMAQGDWLVFLDADDVLLPHAIRALMDCAVKAEAGVAYGMVIERAEAGKLARLNGYDFAAGDPPTAAERTLRRGAVATPGSAIVRADLHRGVGGFVTGYEPLEDRDYFAKCGCLERVAFCDTVVLDKTWRPASHGSQHAKRIYRGQRMQRDLRRWLVEKNRSAAWMPTDAQFVKWALDEAVWWRCPEIIPPLRKIAKELGVSHWRSFLYGAAFRGPCPEWVGVEPRVLDT
jgi:glycosyltransferase involved in cell wall biosynthesis